MAEESRKNISPSRVLVFGFIGTILMGTVFLILPYATTGGISFLDALFTSASAVCVTGLIVKDTAADFTGFGQTVIAVLIQIGGLGYMSLGTFMALLAGKRIGMTERLMMRESLNLSSLEGIARTTKTMFCFVAVAEGLGALVLTVRFLADAPLSQALGLGIFHAVSAFNNAGFSLFSDSLIGYRSDPVILGAVMSLVVLGGIGFVVVVDLKERFRGRTSRLLLHSRIVLWSTAVLLVAGTLLIFFTERAYLFAGEHLGRAEVLLNSLFASVTARTAGFNTLDYARLQPGTLFLTLILMVIGASPGSTGGGIKTTTVSVVLLSLWTTLRGRRDAVVFGRRIPDGLIARSLVLLSLAVIYIAVVTLLIVDMEHTRFLPTLFEVVSAFGTVGLSVGDGGPHSFCADFGAPGKIVIMITMLVGRLGPLTLFTALLEYRDSRVRYPEGKVMIG